MIDDVEAYVSYEHGFRFFEETQQWLADEIITRRRQLPDVINNFAELSQEALLQIKEAEVVMVGLQAERLYDDGYAVSDVVAGHANADRLDAYNAAIDNEANPEVFSAKYWNYLFSMGRV